LAALGIERGERVCVLAQNDAAYVDLYGACARQGIVAYPINWRLTGPEVERVVERARPAMMVVDAATRPAGRRLARGEGGAAPLPAWRGGGGRVRRVRRALPPGRAPRPPRVAPGDAFAVISTAAVDVIPRGCGAHATPTS